MTSPTDLSLAVDTKAQRKAAAAAVDDAEIFERTAYGRSRVPSFGQRLMKIAASAAVPFVLLYRSVARS